MQTRPLCEKVGTPAGFVGLTHFRSSVISGAASVIRARGRESSSPFQSPADSTGFVESLFFAISSPFADRRLTDQTSTHVGAWSLVFSIARTSLSTPAAFNLVASPGLRSRWSMRSPALRENAPRM